MDKLTQEILNIINETIEGQYIGKLIVDHYDNSYILKMYLNRHVTPLILSYEGSEENFKNFIKEEIKNRKLESIDYWEIKRENLYNDGE